MNKRQRKKFVKKFLILNHNKVSFISCDHKHYSIVLKYTKYLEFKHLKRLKNLKMSVNGMEIKGCSGDGSFYIKTINAQHSTA